jgi:uncharacterized FAD-dependent dehydrogenase
LELTLNNLAVPVEQDGMAAYAKAAACRLGIDPDGVVVLKILSKTLDIRDLGQFYYQLSIVVQTPEGYANPHQFPVYQATVEAVRPKKAATERPIIVGFGPAGMFAALELIEHGLRPIIFERGKRIEERTVDVRRFIAVGELHPESNIQFGEGGAGSYSDGKLFSRRDSNTSSVNRVLHTLVRFGAPAEIEYIGKPHLGTDVLCRIVANIREYILGKGGEIHYSARMTDLVIADDRAVGIVVNNTSEHLASRIYIALGHSARDTMQMLHARGVALEQRPIAVGVRIEHPAAVVNRMRYGSKYHDFQGLGAATYSLNHTNQKIRRGVYTFCMCPGGEVVNASSSEGLLVVNGMSYSRRDSPFSNAALVVSCRPEDYPSASPLAGLAFQEAIERKAFCAGGGAWAVPAQNLLHFLGESSDVGIGENSYQMGAVGADMHDVLPAFVTKELHVAFARWRNDLPLFVSDQALLLGAETRTSSPVRIRRNERYESVNVQNLYPIGEGSGYTGGITSSAADAIRAVSLHMAEASR